MRDTIGRRVWASMVNLVTPLLLAAAMSMGVGLACRASLPSLDLPRRNPIAYAGDQPAVSQTAPESRPSAARAEVEPAIENVPLSGVANERHARPGGDAAADTGRSAPAQPRSRQATRTASVRYSFGPARAPSPEAVRHGGRTTEPPPSLASAPEPAPAVRAPTLLAPEPQSAPWASPLQAAEPRRETATGQFVRSVRFDASYYYGRGLSARELAEELTESWAKQGINLIYFYAYNRVYGARYRTSYPGNIMEDYGRQDLLRHMTREAHRRDIKVVAWIQGVQHKQMWEAHPSWREKNADGTDYKPDADSYLLCVRNPEVVQWWLGLLDDLLTNYPDLDGLDLAEFQLDLWGDHACHCEQCRSQFAQAHPDGAIPGDGWRRFRAQGLTRVLLASSRLAHSSGKEVHVTTVFTAGRDGKLLTAAQVRDVTGFDLDGVLSGADRPDVIQAELIWQQWAATYSDGGTFTPEWTAVAVRQARSMVRGRAKLIAHVEVTDFGVGQLDGPALARTIASAAAAGPLGVDIYDAHLLAQTEGVARYLQMAWLGPNR